MLGAASEVLTGQMCDHWDNLTYVGLKIKLLVLVCEKYLVDFATHFCRLL